MLPVSDPNNDAAQERADHLSNDVRHDHRPRKFTNNRQADRYSRVNVSTADRAGCIHAHSDGDGPAGRYHDPAGVLSLCLT